MMERSQTVQGFAPSPLTDSDVSGPARSDFEHEDRLRRGIVARDDAGSFVTNVQQRRLDSRCRNSASYRTVVPADLQFRSREDSLA